MHKIKRKLPLAFFFFFLLKLQWLINNFTKGVSISCNLTLGEQKEENAFVRPLTLVTFLVRDSSLGGCY